MNNSENEVKQNHKKTFFETVLAWRSELLENNGARAKLKRCETPEKAMLLRETHILLERAPKYISAEAIATIAGIIPHIKENGSGKLAENLGKEKNGRAVFSEVRFRNLLACKEWNEFYKALRRAVVILDGIVDPVSVIETIKLWGEEKPGIYKEPSKRLSFKLAKDYYSQTK
ncbi:CRISPR-associated protein CasB/Cse2 [Chitinispirillum alkaliphilum]|nr:CRISPR-associated protein CasB/Cse2 [Chitinispirillum alkaliphilum]